MRREGRAILINAAQRGQREHLESSGIGEDRSVPAHERVQPAETGDALGGGAQIQVIRVAEDHLRPRGTQVRGSQ
jgi:hypothetical protein